MKRIPSFMRFTSLILTSALLYVSCGEKDDISQEKSALAEDSIKVEVTTGDAVDIKPKSVTLTATSTITNANNIQGTACFYYSLNNDKAENIKVNGKKVAAGSISESTSSFSASVSDIEPITKYYYVASVTIGEKEYFGSVKSFTTLANDDKPLVFYQSDGVVRYISYSSLDSVVNTDNLTRYYFNDKRMASYSNQMLDSVSYQYPAGKTVAAFPSASDIINDIAQAKAPDPTDKTEPSADSKASDYGDYIEEYEVKNTITFRWAGNVVTVDGTVPSGVEIVKNNAHVTVRSTKGKMKYCLEGTTTDGSFKIADMDDSSGDDNNKKFVLELNGVDITNPNGPAINIQSGKRVLVNLPVNKVNTLKDGATYTEIQGESQKGTFFSEGQLIFSGPGTLNVTSLGGHGICSDDYIRLRYNLGNINITSSKDGINTKDYFLMYGGNVKVNSSGDGVSVRRGPFELYGGILNISTEDDGITSNYTEGNIANVIIGGGCLSIETTGPKGHAVTTTGKLTLDKGTVTASTEGAASKCLTAGNDIVIKDSYLNLSTQGAPQFDDEEKDWSSAACIRAKSGLSISGSDLYLLSSGKGSKCINAAAGVTVESSVLNVAEQGADYEASGNKVRSRAVDASSLNISAGTTLQVSAALTAIYADSRFDVEGGSIFAYTQSEETKPVNVKGTYSQTGGLVMSGISR